MPAHPSRCSCDSRAKPPESRAQGASDIPDNDARRPNADHVPAHVSLLPRPTLPEQADAAIYFQCL
jgi:hypothetical protein